MGQTPEETETTSSGPHQEGTITDLDPQVEALLGSEGLLEDKPKNEIHPSISNKWSFILIKGLSDDNNEKLIMKYPPPENCLQVAPPVLNPELKVNMKREAISRDDKQKNSQSQLAAALSAIGQSLSRLLTSSVLSREDVLKVIESLSDSGRLLADLHYKNSLHRKYLVLGLGFQQKIKANIKEVLFNSKIDIFLFGKDLSENLEKAKALERNSLSIVEPTFKFQKPNLNKKGPSHQLKTKLSVHGKGDGPTRSYQEHFQHRRQHFSQPRQTFTSRTSNSRSDQMRTQRTKRKQDKREHHQY